MYTSWRIHSTRYNGAIRSKYEDISNILIMFLTVIEHIMYENVPFLS